MVYNNVELLNKLYQNTTMGISALSTIIPKTKNPQLKGELQAQLTNYNNQSEALKTQIYSNNADPQDIGTFAKITSDASILMSTAINGTTSHIAEMMIQGTNMGVIDINKILNHTKVDDQSIITQAQDILTNEQQYIDKLKSYL